MTARSQWKTVTFGDVVELEQGLAFNKKTNHLMAENGIPLLRITDLINNTQSKFVNEQKVPRKFISRPHDIIYTRTGQVGLVFKGKVGIVHNNCFRVIPHDGIERDFVYWYLRQPSIIRQARTLASGSAQPDLGHDAFKSITFTYPEPQVQRRIAEILSVYDDLIENNQRRIKILEEMARSLYREWFVQFRFPGHDKVKMVSSPLGLIPEDWEFSELRNIFQIKYGKTLPKTKIHDQGRYPVYGAGDVIGYYDTHLCPQKVALVTSRGNGSGTVWRTREAAFVTNNSLIIQPQDRFDYWDYSFVELLLSHSNLMEAKTGSAQPQVTIENLNYVKATVPPKDLVERFCKVATPLYEQVDLLFQKCGTLRRTRDLLLPRLLSGQVELNSRDAIA